MDAVAEQAPPRAAHDSQDLARIFDRLFQERWRVVLRSGGDEPLYLPRSPERADSEVIFAHGYFASALHEIAHWCIAGPKRRKLTDYGYWYAPDGRTAAQQRAFERVEVKPQALEWIFARACGSRFRISLDNLSGEPVDPAPFRAAVRQQARRWLEEGLPSRARVFAEALCAFYRRPFPRPCDFDPDSEELSF